jgi:hypothetical protein
MSRSKKDKEVLKLKLPKLQLTPMAYCTDQKTTLWVVDHNVAVFTRQQAEIIFAPGHHYDGLKVWGIKDGKAECFNCLYDAIEFFGEL